jgi:hypothetical protein
MSRNMRRVASEPVDLTGSLSARKAAAQTQGTHVVGSVTIRSFPKSTKRLDVKFVLSADTLKIRLLQEVDSYVRKFDMCSLDLAHLVVGWVWGIKDMFVLAAKHEEKFYYDICCFPADRGRNTWLECFESRGVRTMILFYHDRPLPELSRCNQYLMLSLSESSEGQGSGGSRGAADSGNARGPRVLFSVQEA